MVLMVKNTLANAGNIRDVGLIPGLGRFPGGGHGNPLQYFSQEYPMDRGAGWACPWGCKELDLTEPLTHRNRKMFRFRIIG